MIPNIQTKVLAESTLSDKKIEILLSSDIGATVSTEEYKADLKAKLLAEGFKAENIRFINSAETIKTGNLDMGWNVYDHLNYNETMSSDPIVYTSVTPTSTTEVKDRDRHIYSLNGGKEMTFLGYGQPAYKDFAIYPSDSSDSKIVNFDISADKVDTHTLEGAGFLVNAGVNGSGVLKAYLLFYKFSTPLTGTVYLVEMDDNANTVHNSSNGTIVANPYGYTQYGTIIGSGVPFTIDSVTKKINVNMVVSQGSIKCGYSQYTKDANNNLVKGTEASLFNYSVPLANQTGFNGFGPIVSYTSHGCSSLTMFTFSSLSMKVDTSADNALKQTVWSEDDTVSKFYVNISDKGLNVNNNKDSILSSVIDKSIYYIGAGNNTSAAKTDAEDLNAYTAGSTFVQTVPGTKDATALQNIADIITDRATKGAATPLVVTNIIVENDGTPEEKRTVVIDDPDTEDPSNQFEIVFEDDNGDPQVKTVTATDEGGGTLGIPVPEEALDREWFIVRLPLAPQNPEPTESKLISNSDEVDPVVDFKVINQSDSKQVVSYDMKNGSVTLLIDDNSYSRSSVILSGNSVTTYTITDPEGNTVGSNGTLSLTGANAISGDYSFTTNIAVTKDSVTTNYKITKKISIINDNVAPIVARVSTALNGAGVTTAKNVIVSFEDKDSGLLSYGIIVKSTNTVPVEGDFTLNSVSDADSAYLEVTYALPLKNATNYIFAIAKDKSGNKTITQIDNYTVSQTTAAIVTFNEAVTDEEMANAITQYAGLIGLSLTDFNALTDKTAVYAALKTPVFTTLSGIKTTFDNAVSTSKANELAAAKLIAKAALLDEFNLLKEEDYTVSGWAAVLSAKTAGDNSIDAATTISVVNSAEVAAEVALLDVKTKAEEVSDAITAINNATNTSSVNTLITQYADLLGLDLTGYNALKDKTAVQNKLVDTVFTNTNDIKNLLNLECFRQSEKEALDTVFDAYKESDYLTKGWEAVTKAKNDGITALSLATDNALITKAKEDAIKAMDDVKTAAEELADAKEAAKAELANLLSAYEENDYNSEEWAKLNAAVTAGNTAIDNATSISEVGDSFANAVAALDAIKTIEDIIKDSVDEVNNATTKEDLLAALKSNEFILGLDFEDFDNLLDTTNILDELLAMNLTTEDEVKNALKNAVDKQIIREELEVRILLVDVYLLLTTIDNITYLDVEDLNDVIAEMEDILENDEYLTDESKAKLNDNIDLVKGYVDTLLAIQNDINAVKDIASKIDDAFITTKTKAELTASNDLITELLKDSNNLTEEEVQTLTQAQEKITNAIIVIDKKAESDLNKKKDSNVLLLEKFIDGLPNPDTAKDEDIKASEEDIVGAKKTFDELGDKKTQVAKESVSKLDKLLTRLAKINVKVDSEKAGTKVVASGLGLLVTPEDVATGEDVNITLSVVNKTGEEPNKNAILVILEDGTIGAYFDINIYKQIGSNDPTKLKELGTTVGITIDIPENILGKTNYKIVRVHNGVAETLETVQNGNQLTFYTDKFSTYAIVYEQAVAPTTVTAVATTPNTGDSSVPVFYIAVVTVATVGFIAVRKRKSINE